MSGFTPQVEGANISLLFQMPDMPTEFLTERGPMLLKDMRPWEVEALAECLKAKFLRQWEILTEDEGQRAARVKAAREAEAEGMAEDARKSKGIDRGTMSLIGEPLPARVQAPQPIDATGHGSPTMAAVGEMAAAAE